MEMHPLWMLIDPYLICLYRLTGYAFVDFLIGTSVLAWIALVIGELTIAGVFLLLKDRIDATSHDARRYQDLSADAMASGDNKAYHAANKLANDAFGHSFFLQFGLSAAFLWPVFIVLAWMQTRFAAVDFPFLSLDYTVGYPCIFIPLYVASYMAFKRVKGRLPFFRRINTILSSYGDNGAGPEALPAVPPQEHEGHRT
ncbi:MAG: hypothetical protein V1792_27500 [Pseudomonadota bacterium]